jgi:type IV secretory pathway TrbD component
MFAISFLQILLGILTIYVIELIKYEPFLVFGTALGITILSGLLFIKIFLKNDWKQSLRIWVIAAVMQMVFVPVCSMVMLLGWFVFYFMNHPPQL